MTESLYVFDLDDTLIDGDSAMLWHQYLVKNKIINDADFLEEDNRQMRLYAMGEMDMQQYLDFAVAPLTSINKKQLEKMAMEFAKQCIEPLIFSQAKQLLLKLQQANTTVILISATVDYLVQAIAKLLNIEHAFGIALQSEGKYLTTKIKGIATYREGKVTCFEQWLTDNPVFKKHQVYFYSDSINDKPMCLRADFAFTVNPCAKLTLQAKQNQWPILQWHCK